MSRTTNQERYIQHHQLPVALQIPIPQRLAFAQFITTLERIVETYPPQEKHENLKDVGLRSGSNSIAYLFLRLSILAPDLPLFGVFSCAELCKHYITEPKRRLSYPTPDHRGVANEYLAYAAVIACANQNRELAENIASFADAVCKGEDGSDERLYGRAGFLYILRMLNEYMPGVVKDVVFQTVTARIMQSKGKWKWYGEEYIGAVHGGWGIITQVILSQPSYAPELEDAINGLIDLMFAEGNWPASRGSSRDKPVQFCHGTPGAVPAMLSIQHLYNGPTREKLTKAIEKGREAIWERGMLTKEPCLCHGTSGNAIVLTGSRRMKFMTMTREEIVVENVKRGNHMATEYPEGLWTGLAGRSWAWYIASKEDEGAKFIGFNDL